MRHIVDVVAEKKKVIEFVWCHMNGLSQKGPPTVIPVSENMHTG